MSAWLKIFAGALYLLFGMAIFMVIAPVLLGYYFAVGVWAVWKALAD